MYSVLIVDDDPMVAMINEGYVNRHKDFYVVAKCGDGNSALDFLSNNDVDLIFLDVFMPYMDGFETLRRIREQKINSDVIMVLDHGRIIERGSHDGLLAEKGKYYQLYTGNAIENK